MGEIYNKIEPWIDKEKYAFTSFSLLVGIALFIIYIFKYDVSDEKDLIHVTEKIENYSFERGGRGTYHFYIYLTGYSNNFQISAELVDLFKKKEFEKEISRGELITIGIPKSSQSQLKVDDSDILIFSLSNNKKQYLDSKESLSTYNQGVEIIGGIGFILAGLIYYKYRSRKR